MVVTFNKKKLNDALKVGAKLSGQSKMMPILDCIKIDVLQDSVVITSSNMEHTISVSTECEHFTEEFSFCVNGQNMIRAVSSISDEEVIIEVSDESVEIHHSTGVITFPIYRSEEFPSVNKDDEICSFSVSPTTLAYIVATSKDFTSNDELRPAMQGLYLEIDAERNSIEYCATDSHILVSEKLDGCVSASSSDKFIVKNNALPLILDICRTKSDVTFKTYENNVVIYNENVELTAMKVEGRYPQFKNIINMLDGNDKVVKVDKHELKNALDRVSICCNSTKLIRFDVEKYETKVRAEDIDFSKKSMETLKTDSVFDMSFGISYNNAIKCIGNIGGDMSIKLSAPNKAIVFHDSKHDNRSMLAMPVMLNN